MHVRTVCERTTLCWKPASALKRMSRWIFRTDLRGHFLSPACCEQTLTRIRCDVSLVPRPNEARSLPTASIIDKRPFDISFLEPALCSFMFAVFFHAPTVCFACVRGRRMCYSSLVEGGVYNLCGTQSGLSHGLPLCSDAVWPAPVSSSRSQ